MFFLRPSRVTVPESHTSRLADASRWLKDSKARDDWELVQDPWGRLVALRPAEGPPPPERPRERVGAFKVAAWLARRELTSHSSKEGSSIIRRCLGIPPGRWVEWGRTGRLTVGQFQRLAREVAHWSEDPPPADPGAAGGVAATGGTGGSTPPAADAASAGKVAPGADSEADGLDDHNAPEGAWPQAKDAGADEVADDSADTAAISATEAAAAGKAADAAPAPRDSKSAGAVHPAEAATGADPAPAAAAPRPLPAAEATRAMLMGTQLSFLPGQGWSGADTAARLGDLGRLADRLTRTADGRASRLRFVEGVDEGASLYSIDRRDGTVYVNTAHPQWDDGEAVRTALLAPLAAERQDDLVDLLARGRLEHGSQLHGLATAMAEDPQGTWFVEAVLAVAGEQAGRASSAR